MRSHRIPTSVLAPIVKQHLGTMVMGEIIEPAKGWGDSLDSNEVVWTVKQRTYSAIEALAFRADVKADTLYKIVTERLTSTSFSIADKILAYGMGSPQLWYTSDLADYYWPEGKPEFFEQARAVFAFA